ncbi:MAG: chemotaxis protein CheB [Chloroflexota bacterium]
MTQLLVTPFLSEKTAFDLVVIVTSLGGLNALTRILSVLPASFPAAMAVVQHLPQDAPKLLVDILSCRTPLRVKWAEDGEGVSPGTVYIAPPNAHLLMNANRHFMLSRAAPVQFVRPSGDLLFETAAAAFKTRLIGLVLTGRAGDGSRGITMIRQAGGVTLAQDEASSSAFSMPKKAIETGHVDFILALDDIAAKLCELMTDSSRPSSVSSASL